MTDERWQRGWDLFHAALAIDPSGRAAFLDQGCADDAALRAEVMQLLEAHDEAPAFLEHRLSLDADSFDADPLEGQRIGAYVVRRVLGEGGMGVVCDAEQQGVVRRRVALKLVRPGMESREIAARFTAERQALALMNHPNVATAYEVGVAGDGRPFVAMEYVDGPPITEFCDRHRLDIRQRLRLFLDVCDAVQHAHQKGIIHRDLKPSNVLVDTRDGKAAPKVIDFGIAKAIDAGSADRSFHTQIGNIVGTPAYMSPEQAGIAGIDVDTRADVYSLGVLLFELLVGSLPIDPSRLRGARPAEIERLLFEGDAVRPSQRFNALGSGRAVAAHNRSTRPSTLLRVLRGDLEWVVAKAMERDRTGRYATVSDLAADVSRYLAHEPVQAGPPTAGYRVRKFVVRHRTGVSVAAVIAIAVAVFVVLTIRQSAATQRALEQAEAERMRAEQVGGFLVELFEVPDPGEVRGNAVTAREILDRGAQRITQSLATQPEVRARLMNTIGNVYRNLGLYDPAEALLTEALEQRRALHGPAHAEVADTLTNLANVTQMRGDYREALAGHREALEMRRLLLGPGHADVGESLSNICTLHRLLGEDDAAIESCEEGLAIREQQLGPESLEVATTLVNLATALNQKGDFERAEAIHRRALDIRRARLGDNHLEVARSKNNLAAVLFRRGRESAAEPLYREALATMQSVLDPAHDDLANVMNNLAVVLRGRAELEGAEDLYRQALAIRRTRLGPRHPEVAVALNNLAFVVKDRDNPSGAADLYREALEIFRESLGESHVNYANVLHNLAEVLFEAGDPRAEVTAREALTRKLTVLPRDHPSTAASLLLVGHLQALHGQPGPAEPTLREALASLRRTLPEEHPRVAQAKARLGSCLLDLKQYDEAASLLREGHKVLARQASLRDARWVEGRLAALTLAAAR
jgi:serine/threonine protein kinase/tetratricopeptide (TPR) repeat protein